MRALLLAEAALSACGVGAAKGRDAVRQDPAGAEPHVDGSFMHMLLLGSTMASRASETSILAGRRSQTVGYHREWFVYKSASFTCHAECRGGAVGAVDNTVGAAGAEGGGVAAISLTPGKL